MIDKSTNNNKLNSFSRSEKKQKNKFKDRI